MVLEKCDCIVIARKACERMGANVRWQKMIEGGWFTSLSKCAKIVFILKNLQFEKLIKHSIMDDQTTILHTKIWGN